MPSGSTSPVTLPNKVSTPTCPDCTLVTDANRRITTRNAAMPKLSRCRTWLLPTSTTLPRASEYIVIRVLSPPGFYSEVSRPCVPGLLCAPALRRSPGRHSTPHVQRKGRSAPRSSTPGSVVYLATIYLGGRLILETLNGGVLATLKRRRGVRSRC